MQRLDLVVGATYRARHPRRVATLDGDGYNDRRIIWMNPQKGCVSYDGPAVRAGRRYSMVSTKAFLLWASHRIEEKT